MIDPWLEIAEWGQRGKPWREKVATVLLYPFRFTDIGMWKYSLGIGKENEIRTWWGQNRWTVFWCRWRGHIWGTAYDGGCCDPVCDCERCGDRMDL